MTEYDVVVYLSFEIGKASDMPLALFKYTCPIFGEYECISVPMREGDFMNAKSFVKKIKKFISNGDLERTITSRAKERHIQLYGSKKSKDVLKDINELWEDDKTIYLNIKINN